MERRELEKQIIEKEWLMFQKVQDVNGRASCQDDWTTFLIMRISQFEGWDMNVLESYYDDIEQAEAQERNLIMEKYAYMMEETDPVYFLSIKGMLPEISEEKQLMAEKITSIYMEWEKEADIKYPNIRRHGRPAEGIGVDGTVSVRNYLKCELYTYSVKTLALDEVMPSIETIKDGSYILQRPFVMATMGEIGEQSDAVQAIFTYLKSDAGKQIVESVGLVTVD